MYKRQFQSYSNGSNADWAELGVPGSSVGEVHLYDAGYGDKRIDIYVIDDVGQLFKSPDGNHETWLEVAEGPVQHYYYWEDCSTESFKRALVPPFYPDDIPEKAFRSPSYPDKEVRECRRYIWNWETVADQTYVLLTEDGSVFAWRYSPSLGILLRYTLTGAGIGFLTSILILLINRFREKQSSPI